MRRRTRSTSSTRKRKNNQLRFIRARLIEISLKIDNYIYKNKPISKEDAELFLNEILSYTDQCTGDAGSNQVIEKLTKYMKIIIRENSNLIDNEPQRNVDDVSNTNTDSMSFKNSANNNNEHLDKHANNSIESNQNHLSATANKNGIVNLMGSEDKKNVVTHKNHNPGLDPDMTNSIDKNTLNSTIKTSEVFNNSPMSQHILENFEDIINHNRPKTVLTSIIEKISQSNTSTQNNIKSITDTSHDIPLLSPNILENFDDIKNDNRTSQQMPSVIMELSQNKQNTVTSITETTDDRNISLGSPTILENFENIDNRIWSNTHTTIGERCDLSNNTNHNNQNTKKLITAKFNDLNISTISQNILEKFEIISNNDGNRTNGHNMIKKGSQNNNIKVNNVIQDILVSQTQNATKTDLDNKCDRLAGINNNSATLHVNTNSSVNPLKKQSDDTRQLSQINLTKRTEFNTDKENDNVKRNNNLEKPVDAHIGEARAMCVIDNIGNPYTSVNVENGILNKNSLAKESKAKRNKRVNKNKDKISKPKNHKVIEEKKLKRRYKKRNSLINNSENCPKNILLPFSNSKTKISNKKYNITKDDLEWLNTIKYVRVVDSQEYVEQTDFDENFWNSNILPINLNEQDFLL